MGMGSKTSSKASLGGLAEENERLHCVITEKDAAITALQVLLPLVPRGPWDCFEPLFPSKIKRASAGMAGVRRANLRR